MYECKWIHVSVSICLCEESWMMWCEDVWVMWCDVMYFNVELSNCWYDASSQTHVDFDFVTK